MIESAADFYNAGFSVIRASLDGTKSPLGQWKQHQTQRAEPDTLSTWFSSGVHTGMGVVCGQVSGNLEMLELEGRAVAEGLDEKFYRALAAVGLADLLTLIFHGYSEISPSGGLHFFYRVSDQPVSGNLKLASRPARDDELDDGERERFQRTGKRPPRVLIETRGEGGFVVVAPSSGSCHPTGEPWRVLGGKPGNVPTISGEQRGRLHEVARAFDSMPAAAPMPATTTLTRPAGELAPGEDYNIRAQWPDILQPHGWTIHSYGAGDVIFWTRPGKDDGKSACTGGDNGDRFYAWTTSSELPDNEALSKWRVYAKLNHADDYQKAASALRKQGYGTALPARVAAEADPDWLTVAARPVTPTPPNDLDTGQLGDDPFWDSRPVLGHIRHYAYSRRCPPWAVFVHVLLRIVASVPPQVRLPPLVGGVGSLNLFAAIVGDSSSGKGGSRSCAKGALHIIGDDTDECTIGSGEGIAATYMKPGKKVKVGDISDSEPIQYRSRALFMVSEVDTLAGLHGRGGSTLLPELRKVYSGESLGFQNRSHETRLPVKAHVYRACLSIDVQPGRASVLLDDADGGTPQRFMWTNTLAPDAPDLTPLSPTPWKWQLPDELHPGKTNQDQIIMPVCDTARRVIDSAALARLRGQHDAADGHLLYTQLKVAAGLAVLDQRCSVLESDWALAEYIMARSSRVRATLEADHRARFQEANKAKGKSEAERELVKNKVIETDSMGKVCKTILKHLAREPMTRAPLRRKMQYKDRDIFDEAVDGLVATGQVIAVKVDGTGESGTIYRLPQ